jgi:hypothetical protein
MEIITWGMLITAQFRNLIYCGNDDYYYLLECDVL